MTRLLLIPALLLTVAASTLAQKPAPALSPDEAGPDYALQGEYVGQLKEEGEKFGYGVQVIALGKGKFRAVAYHGGLPGAGWNGEEKIQVEGERDGDRVVFDADKAKGILADGELTVVTKDGVEIGQLKRTVRKSPTLGKKPPKGAVVLFGGKDDAEKWKGGKVDENGWLQQGATSKQTFGGPFTLHVEFLLSYMPHARGQGRSNSGVYLQGRHEVQVLDSFGLEGKHNECGGIYSVKDPDVNMCLPPLQWQTYDVEFTPAKFENGKKVANARMTVRHNGVVVHEDVEVPKSTTAAPVKEGPEPGPIYIQNHGNPLRFRNIWVVPKDS